MCLQEVKLLDPSKPKPNNPLANGENVALAARVRASSCAPGYTEAAVVDMVVDGYPDSANREWASNRERDTAMIRLDWTSEQTVDRVWLFDNPSKKQNSSTPSTPRRVTPVRNVAVIAEHSGAVNSHQASVKGAGPSRS
jgi:hypothetical protein